VRIAVVSDVHGNLAALEAVLADLELLAPDLVAHGGDLAFNGPRPAECVDRIRELGWPGVVGNTEEALWTTENIIRAVRPMFELRVPSTLALLGEDRVWWLRCLPQEWRSGNGLVLVHAAPGNLWRAPGADAKDDELQRTYGPLGAKVAVYGHIHRPYVRQLEALIVANSGSAGMPWDGDPRAAYLLVDGGVPTVRRVEYDVERHVADLLASGYPDADILAEGARAGRLVRRG
jgi:predicted phosphodiesterase